MPLKDKKKREVKRGQGGSGGRQVKGNKTVLLVRVRTSTASPAEEPEKKFLLRELESRVEQSGSQRPSRHLLSLAKEGLVR